MNVINTSVRSIFSHSTFKDNNQSMAQSMQNPTTGNRINGAKDDAGNMAAAQNMSTQIHGLNQSIRNANEAIGLLQTAEDAMIEQTKILQRMRELAIQASNDSNLLTQSGILEQEFDQLRQDLNRIASETQWNGENILDGTNATKTFHIGTKEGTVIKHTITTVHGLFDANFDISGANTTSALDTLSKSLNSLASARSSIGTIINQLTYAVDDLTNVSLNSSVSRDQIQDTDYAAATTELSRTQIIQQAVTAMLAQANQQPASVLSLLR